MRVFCSPMPFILTRVHWTNNRNSVSFCFAYYYSSFHYYLLVTTLHDGTFWRQHVVEATHRTMNWRELLIGVSIQTSTFYINTAVRPSVQHTFNGSAHVPIDAKKTNVTIYLERTDDWVTQYVYIVQHASTMASACVCMSPIQRAHATWSRYANRAIQFHVHVKSFRLFICRKYLPMLWLWLRLVEIVSNWRSINSFKRNIHGTRRIWV